MNAAEFERVFTFQPESVNEGHPDTISEPLAFLRFAPESCIKASLIAFGGVFLIRTCCW